MPHPHDGLMTPHSLRYYATHQMKIVDAAYCNATKAASEAVPTWQNEGLEAFREARKAKFAAWYMERNNLEAVKQIGSFHQRDIKIGDCVRILRGAPIMVANGGQNSEEHNRYMNGSQIAVERCHRIAERSYIVQVTESLRYENVGDYNHEDIQESDWDSIDFEMFQRIGWQSGHRYLRSMINHIEIL